jgi:CheY-like chemotaxis protein
VLLVEDDATGREMMATLLELSGATVTAVGSAAEALAALDASWQDVMVSDIAMPDRDGYTLIRQVRARPAERGGLIPALALSGYTEAGDRALALDAGFHVHLSKPVAPAELVAGIAALGGHAVTGQ